VNISKPEIAHPVTNPLGLVHATAVSLPLLSARKLTGFFSLLNGLLAQRGTATGDIADSRPPKRVAATLPLHAATANDKGEKNKNTPEIRLQPAVVRAGPLATSAGTPAPLSTGQLPTASTNEEHAIAHVTEASQASTYSQSSTLPNFPSTATASRLSDASGLRPSSARAVAFALRLTWQPPAPDTQATKGTLSPSAVSTPRAPDRSNPVDVPNPPAAPDAAPDTERVDPQSFRVGGNPPPVRSLDADTTIREGASFRSPETTDRIRNGNVNTPLNQSPVLGENSVETLRLSEAGSNPAEIDTQPLGLTRTPAPDREKTSAVSFCAGAIQDFFAPETEVPREASAWRSPRQEEGQESESAASKRPLVSPSANVTATRQGTSRDDSQNTASCDASDPESGGRAPSIHNPEKPSQIQSSREHPAAVPTGVLLDRPVESAGAPQPRTKIQIPEPPQASTASPDLESSRTVQPQPIREISLHLGLAASANVDVQVAQRAGKLQVAVRTGDQELAKSLQANLGELVGRLEEKGFRTEAWTPVTSPHESGAVKEPSNAANSQTQSDQSGSRGGQQDPGHERQESNQRRQGHWKAQLEGGFDDELSAPSTKTYEEKRP